MTAWSYAGQDVTDYFNYGFDENSWKEYTEKQRALREEHQDRVRVWTRAAHVLTAS